MSIFFPKLLKPHLLSKKDTTIALFIKNRHHLFHVLKGDDSNEEATGHSNSSTGFMQKMRNMWVGSKKHWGRNWPWFLPHLYMCKMYFCQYCFLYQWSTVKLHYGYVSLCIFMPFVTSLEKKVWCTLPTRLAKKRLHSFLFRCEKQWQFLEKISVARSFLAFFFLF